MLLIYVTCRQTPHQVLVVNDIKATNTVSRILYFEPVDVVDAEMGTVKL